MDRIGGMSWGRFTVETRRARRSLGGVGGTCTAEAQRARRILLLVLLMAAAYLSAQESASEPTFDLLGIVSQKLTYNAPQWDFHPGSTWAFTAALRPQFRYSGASFQADSTWTLPMNADLVSRPVTVAVPEAYFRLTPVDSLDFTFGQKRFSLGVGQTFTVGDSLNPVVGFFDQKTGFRGATVEWSPVSWASVSGAASTDTGAAQVSLLLDQLQLTVSAVGRKDAALNPAVGLSYDLFGVIVTAEGAGELSALSGSAGARWAVTLGDWDATVSAEYLHWAQAKKTAPVRNQENAFFRASLVTGGTFAVTGFAAVDLEDRSVLGQGSATWTPWDNLDLTATLQAAEGDSRTSWQFLNAAKDRYQASFSTTYHF